MSKYTVYNGDFNCHVCKADVKTLRCYGEAKRLTWMCAEKHISNVDLTTKRKKQEHDRAIGK